MGAIIWQKVTTCNTTGGASIMGSFPHPRNGIVKLDYEFILIFKKYGKAPKPNDHAKRKSEMTTEEWNKYFTGHWNFAGEKQDKHLAMFPEELPKRLIKMFSFVGETVLDPFLGSGTTTLAAKNLERNSIGYEINNGFMPAIRNRIGFIQQDAINQPKYEIIKQVKLHIDFNTEIGKLPYIFKDPIEFDKKVDPRKLKFGSKIDGKEAKREEYHTVNEVLSPELLKLDNGIVVRLLGVKEDPNQNGKASEYLTKKTNGQKIFLKFDEYKYDKQNHLLAYVYLKNKTFLNAHLLKNGLVKVDTKHEYKYKKKFESIANVEKRS
jgi:site-specific DNA-methyltransferase (adenine-specific)